MTRRPIVLSAMIIVGMLLAPASARALENTADAGTWNMALPGRILATAQYGNVLFVGGRFGRVQANPSGSGGAGYAVSNLAAIDMTTSQIEEDQTAWDLVVTATRVYGGLGREPNCAPLTGWVRLLDGSRVWRVGTTGDVQSISLLGGDLVIGGHFGTHLEQRVCDNQLLKNLGILRGVAGETSRQLDCGLLPQFFGPNEFGGVWEIQVTASALWTGGEFTKVGDVGYRGVARFTLLSPNG